MGNAGRNGGQYYTPRPLIRTMVQMLNPKVGETIYDGACGSAGFLVEAYNYLSEKNKNLSATEFETIQTKTLYGREKSPLAYLIGVMNMILHGVEVPNIEKDNTLRINTLDIQESDRFNVILANPPFGGKERAEFKDNFSIKTSETAYLFLQHFMKSLKAGGRCAVVIKNTFLSNSDASKLRKELLTNYNLHTILDLPQKTFLGAGVKTVVLFFEKGKKTKDIWYYQFVPDRSLGKTSPLNENDLADFRKLYSKRSETENSWVIKAEDIDEKSFDLTVSNPNTPEDAPLRDPIDILSEMENLDSETKTIIESIKGII
jgi:type I restriction enzyme M protein